MCESNQERHVRKAALFAKDLKPLDNSSCVSACPNDDVGHVPRGIQAPTHDQTRDLNVAVMPNKTRCEGGSLIGKMLVRGPVGMGLAPAGFLTPLLEPFKGYFPNIWG